MFSSFFLTAQHSALESDYLHIGEKVKEARLRLLGCVERNTEEYAVMTTWKMEVSGHRKIERPKLRWSDVIRKYTKEKQVQARRT